MKADLALLMNRDSPMAKPFILVFLLPPCLLRLCLD